MMRIFFMSLVITNKGYSYKNPYVDYSTVGIMELLSCEVFDLKITISSFVFLISQFMNP